LAAKKVAITTESHKLSVLNAPIARGRSDMTSPAAPSNLRDMRANRSCFRNPNWESILNSQYLGKVNHLRSGGASKKKPQHATNGVDKHFAAPHISNVALQQKRWLMLAHQARRLNYG
jgi:hypothetical protein